MLAARRHGRHPACATPPTGATRFAHDADGNRTTRTPATGAATTYTYDRENRLTRYNTSATYVYDGTGLRLSKTVSGSTKRQVWDRASGPPQLLSDGNNNYVYGPDGLPLQQINAAGTTVTFIHHDQLGSTRLLTNTSGANVGSYTYDAYGKQAAKTGTATTPLGFAGQYTDAETGLVYMRARHYDPETGQFLTRDPAEERTRQPYSYAENDPMNLTDPTGRDPLEDVANFAAGFGDAASDALTRGRPELRLARQIGLPTTTEDIRDWAGINSTDPNSAAYGWGETGFDAWSCAIGGAGAARTLKDAGYFYRRMERQKRGGVSIFNIRNSNLPPKDNRNFALDRHRIPERPDGRPRVHIDMPQRGIRHWPYGRK